jgi:hypothetical protein
LGHTGFVGSNLLGQFPFGACFNSKNIVELAGREFELIVCSAVSAVKWQANRDPEGDWRGIAPLLEVLGQTRAARFILISTVDVYPNPNGVAEDFDPSSSTNHAYGRHRLQVEQFVARQFSDHFIVRLPGLFGSGLKKNVIFDLLNDRGLEAINPASAFQYYYLARLWQDLDRAVAQGLRLLNVATEPVPTQAIVDRFFPGRAVGSQPAPLANYDFRSRHADLWSGRDGYLYSAATVLDDLAQYLAVHPQWQRLLP